MKLANDICSRMEDYSNFSLVEFSAVRYEENEYRYVTREEFVNLVTPVLETYIKKAAKEIAAEFGFDETGEDYIKEILKKL